MSDNKDNKGIIVQGQGKIDATQVVSGERSSASIVYGTNRNEDALNEIRKKLENLLVAIDENREMISNPDEIRQNAQLVAQEVAKNTPNRLTVTSVLDGICGAVKSATGLTLAAEAFKMAIMKILG